MRKYIAPAIEAGLVPGGPPLTAQQWSVLVADWFPELADRSQRQKTWPEIEPHRERIRRSLGVVTVATIHQRLRDDEGLEASTPRWPGPRCGCCATRRRRATKPRWTTGCWAGGWTR